MRLRFEHNNLLKRIAERAPGEIQRGMLRFITAAEGFALQQVPVVTGNLKASITSEVSGDAGILKATAPYAVFVHEGTGRYGPKGRSFEVKPKNKKALYWVGARHPVKRVVIRGAKPQPFFTQAIKDTEEKLPPEKLFGETLL